MFAQVWVGTLKIENWMLLESHKLVFVFSAPLLTGLEFSVPRWGWSIIAGQSLKKSAMIITRFAWDWEIGIREKFRIRERLGKLAKLQKIINYNLIKIKRRKING